MKLRIEGIRDAGDISKERVVLKANGDGDIGKFLLLTSRVTGEQTVSNRVFAPFWFPDNKVNDGDLVVVYTKNGKFNAKINDNKSHSYFYYLGRELPIYEDLTRCAVVIEVGDWDFLQRKV